MLLKFLNFALKPLVCKMGGNFQLQNGLNFLCRVWPSDQRPKRCMIWSQLDAWYFFKICSLLLEKAIFENFRFLKNLKICSQLLEKAIFENFRFLKNLKICSQLLEKAIFENFRFLKNLNFFRVLLCGAPTKFENLVNETNLENMRFYATKTKRCQIAT